MRLLPEDYQFIELIQSEVSEHSAIPLEIKPDKVKTIIGDAAKYFYEWHPQACERKHFLVKRSDIINATVGNINSILKLPEAIKFIFRIRRADSSTILSEASYLRSPLMGMSRFSGGGVSGLGGGGSIGSPQDMVSITLSMYEHQTLNSLSSGNRGVAHGWSELTNQITFLSDVDNDLVIECGVRIPITNLYNDRLFKEYVKGQCLQSLSRIVGTFEHRYVGGVTINWAEWKSDGKEMVEKAEEELKIYNTNNFIIHK